METDLKPIVHAHCMHCLQLRLNDIRVAINRAQEAAAGEDKSSAGDKYETSRAMSHLDLERYASQEKNLLEELHLLRRVDPNKKIEVAMPGALIETDLGLLYIAAAIGIISCEGHSVTVVSGKSPLALAFKQKKPGDQVAFNGKKYKIIKVC